MKYLCLDMAINTAYPIIPLQKEFTENECLFKETDDDFIWDAAPWLFNLNQKDFYTFITDPLITFHHNLIIESSENITFLRQHLQQFLYVQDNGQTYYYRFWDARVLLKELPTYTEEKLNQFFNNYIQAVYLEDGNKDQLLKLSLNKRQLLNIEKIGRSNLFAPVAEIADQINEQQTQKTNYPNVQQPNAPVKKRRFWAD